MDRRTFVELGTSGAPALLMLSGTPAGPRLPLSWSAQPLTTSDLDTYLQTMDLGLERLGTQRLLADAAPSEHEQLARASLRTLYAVGMLGDLPVENQVDARVQKRLLELSPEIDATTDEMRRHLELRTASEWADLQTILRHRQNPAMEITELLMDGASDLGLSRKRRLHTRALITHATLRLRSQPPELVVAEYLDQVQRLTDSRSMDVMAQRNLAAKLGEAAFWNERENTLRETPRGLKTMGWGLAIFAASGLIVAAGGFVAVFGMTAGAIVMLVGLIQLMASGGNRDRLEGGR